MSRIPFQVQRDHNPVWICPMTMVPENLRVLDPVMPNMELSDGATIKLLWAALYSGQSVTELWFWKRCFSLSDCSVLTYMCPKIATIQFGPAGLHRIAAESCISLLGILSLVRYNI